MKFVELLHLSAQDLHNYSKMIGTLTYRQIIKKQNYNSQLSVFSFQLDSFTNYFSYFCRTTILNRK